MTTLTATRPAAAAPARPDGRGATFPRVVASEWIKFRTVRSTVWTLAITLVLMAGVTLLIAWGMTQSDVDDSIGTGMLLSLSVTMAWLPVAVLGVLAVSGEYTTGMIRSTLAAVPRRVPALLAKALVLFVVVFATGTVGVALSWLVTLPFHDDLGVDLDLGRAGELRILLGTPLLLATIAVFAAAVGGMLRHTAAAMATVLGLMLVVENVFALVPVTLFQNISPFLPMTAGSQLVADDAMLDMMREMSDTVVLSPWQGYGVLVAWVVVLMTAAAVLLRRRDA